MFHNPSNSSSSLDSPSLPNSIVSNFLVFKLNDNNWVSLLTSYLSFLLYNVFTKYAVSSFANAALYPIADSPSLLSDLVNIFSELS